MAPDGIRKIGAIAAPSQNIRLALVRRLNHFVSIKALISFGFQGLQVVWVFLSAEPEVRNTDDADKAIFASRRMAVQAPSWAVFNSDILLKKFKASTGATVQWILSHLRTFIPLAVFVYGFHPPERICFSYFRCQWLDDGRCR